MSKIIMPNRFVGLHAHSGAGSPYDGLGYPSQHIDFVLSNGMNAWCLTDHGNGNGLLIGYNENLAEPLVLGNSLESMLKELIHVNLFLLDELTKVSDNLLKHTHSGVTPGGAVTQPANAPPTLPLVLDTDNFVSTESGNIDLRYKNLRDNLSHMLSRFAKTT